MSERIYVTSDGHSISIPIPAVDASTIVKVGDVVQVESPPDVDPSWRLEGTIINRPSSGLRLDRDLWISFKPGGELLMPSDATVRLVRRAEPEPDPEQVKALADALDAAEEQGDGLYDTAQLARELVRRGVTVRKDTP